MSGPSDPATTLALEEFEAESILENERFLPNDENATRDLPELDAESAPAGASAEAPAARRAVPQRRSRKTAANAPSTPGETDEGARAPAKRTTSPRRPRRPTTATPPAPGNASPTGAANGTAPAKRAPARRPRSSSNRAKNNGTDQKNEN